MNRSSWPVLALLVAAPLLALGACTPIYPHVSFAHVDIAAPVVQAEGNDYDAVRDRWTRRLHHTRAWDTALDGRVTLLSEEYRASLYRKLTDMQRLADSDRAELAERQRAEGERYIEFFVELDTSRWEWNDLASGHSVWTLTLTDDKGHVVGKPEVSIPIEKLTLLESLYQGIGPFTRTFRLRFPRQLTDGTQLISASTGALVLRFSGPLGSEELRWDAAR